MNVHQMGGKTADCGALQPMTTRPMKSGAFVKVSSACRRRVHVALGLGQHF